MTNFQYTAVYLPTPKGSNGDAAKTDHTRARPEPQRETTKPCSSLYLGHIVSSSGLQQAHTALPSQFCPLQSMAPLSWACSAPRLASLTSWLPASPSQLHAVTSKGLQGAPQFCHLLPGFSNFLEHSCKRP